MVVFERDDRIGGLLRYGIPEFKMEKRHIDRRLAQMEAEGTQFRAGVNVGVDITAEQLRSEFDAVVLAGGATDARDLPVPGRELGGIHQAMEYLPLANRAERWLSRLSADRRRRQEGRHHRWRRHRRGLPRHRTTPGRCLGAPVRDHAAAAGVARSVHAVADLPTDVPGVVRARRGCMSASLRVNTLAEFLRKLPTVVVHALSAHEVADGGRQVRAGWRVSDFELECDLVLLAMGFVWPRRARPAGPTSASTSTGAASCPLSAEFESSVPGVFVAGDMGRGQSLIVWAIAEGRGAAAAADQYLRGLARPALPVAIAPTARPLV